MPLTSEYVCGLVDGEGSFTIYVVPDAVAEPRRRRAKVEPRFIVKLQECDRCVLELLQRFFGCGKIYRQADRRKNHRACYRFEVHSRRELSEVIIPFFQEHRLHMPSKQRDFELFADILKRLNLGDHANQSGLHEIRMLKARMHLGSPDAGNPRVRWGS